MPNPTNTTSGSSASVQPAPSDIASLAGDFTPSAAQAPPPPAAPPIDSTLSQGVGDFSATQPQVAPPPPKTSMWRSMLMGALSGLAGASGSKSFGGGLAAGAAGDIAEQQRQVNNAQTQQALNQRQQQINQSQQAISFQSQEAASRMAIASADERRRDQLFQQHQTGIDNQNADTLAGYKQLGIQPILLTTDETGDATAALSRAAQMYGGNIPPLQTLQVGHQIYVFDANQIAQTNSEAARKLVNNANYLQTGTQSTYDAGTWNNTMSPQERAAKVDAAMSYMRMTPSTDMTPANIDAAIARTQNELSLFRFNAAPGTDTDKVVAQKTNELQLYKNYKQQLTDDANAAAQRQADIRSAPTVVKEQFDGAQGSSTQSVAQQLVEGYLDPSQLSKRGQNYNDVLTAANAYSMQKYGVPFDAATAQSDYKYATNKSTQDTLRYLNSLTGANGQGGNLQQLVNASNGITRTSFPALNDSAAWARLAVGDPKIAAYQTDVTEVADQVAKILQGGGSGNGTSDAKLKQAQELFNTGFSKDQITGVAGELRGLLGNRKAELIGNNRYLQRQFSGAPSAPTSQPTAAPSASRVVPKGATPGRDSNGNIVGYKTADGQVVKF